MPRRSSASYVTPTFPDKPQVPKPSAGLPPAVKKIFHELIRTTPAGHFRVSDGPVLESFSSAVAMSRQAEQELALSGPILPDGKPSPWMKVASEAAKTIASLSMRLRLCPQSRATSRTTGREKEFLGPRPWEDKIIEEASDDAEVAPKAAGFSRPQPRPPGH